MRTAGKLNNIQMLRAYASVAVVFAHTGFQFGPVHSLGTFGVDLFFVISGYIMARILDSEKTRPYFLRRRVLRIVPPYWFFTIIVFAASILVPRMMMSTRPDVLQLVKSLLFIPFFKSAGVIRPILFVGWSVNYEMFFYCALAIGLAVSARRAAWVGSGIILGVQVLCSMSTRFGAMSQFYGDPVMIEFVMGVIGYFVCKLIGEVRSTAGKIVLVSACIAASLALAGLEGFQIYLTSVHAVSLGIIAWVAVCSAALLAVSGWDTQNRLLVLIGDASYILYLLHPFVVDTLDRALSKKLGGHLSRFTFSGMLTDVTVSVVFAILFHLYLERPLLHVLTSRFGGQRPSSEFAQALPN